MTHRSVMKFTFKVLRTGQRGLIRLGSEANRRDEPASVVLGSIGAIDKPLCP